MPRVAATGVQPAEDSRERGGDADQGGEPHGHWFYQTLDSPAPVRSSPRLAIVHGALDALLATTDRSARRDSDPVSFVHRYARDDDREVVGLVAASLAFGNVTAIRAKVAIVLDALGPSPAEAVDAGDGAGLARALRGFVHRVWKGDDVAAMLANAGAIRREHGSLGRALARFLEDADASGLDREDAFVEALARLADALRGRRPSRGLRHLVPIPAPAARAGACSSTCAGWRVPVMGSISGSGRSTRPVW